nr:RNA-directed DNA polymerase, eukaryota [Tanacetum cinerariifolium]
MTKQTASNMPTCIYQNDMSHFKVVKDSWNDSSLTDNNSIVLLKRKFQALKVAIKTWNKEVKVKSNDSRLIITNRLAAIDKLLDQGKGNSNLVQERSGLMKDIQEINKNLALDLAQKAKVRWSIEG